MNWYTPSLLALLSLTGCGSTSAEVVELQSTWERRITAAVPIGTRLADAKLWLQAQGAKPYPGRAVSDGNDPIYALGTLRAREWYCDNWVVLVTVRTSPDGRVSRYDFSSSGLCL